jgi:[glutamine synthetase] adenylyltransferase / [glutamine synthetase]-adenylyl-L-tyrosine phosphorylase
LSLYDVDLRLRPSGGKGPVAVTLDAFRNYHARESETWERMALTRARVVAGDRECAEDVKATVISTYARKVDPRILARDVLAMRDLVAKEKPGKSSWDLKLASGGLVDIEFAAQFLLLRHGSAVPGTIDANTGSALRKLADHGLLDPARSQILLDAWRLQSRLAQLIAIGPGADFDPASVRKPFRQSLAAAAELPDFAVLERSLRELQHAAHDVMRDVIRA